MFDTKDIKVGDEVLVCISDWGRKDYIGVVVKKTPKGLVDVKVGNGITRYKQNGREFGRRSRYSRCISWLETLTEEKKEELRIEQERYKSLCCIKEFDYEKLTNEELAKIVKLLGTMKYKEE